MSNAAIGTLVGHEGPYLKVSVEVEARKWQVWGPAGPILPQTKQTPPLLTKPTKTNPNHDSMYSCADVVVHLWMTSTVCVFLCGCRCASMDVGRQSWVLVLRCLPPFGWHRSLTGTLPQLDQVQEHPVFAPASHHCWVCAPRQLLPWIVGIRTQVLKFESQVFYWLSISPATQKPWLLTKKKNTGSIWHPHFQLIRQKFHFRPLMVRYPSYCKNTNLPDFITLFLGRPPATTTLAFSEHLTVHLSFPIPFLGLRREI